MSVSAETRGRSSRACPFQTRVRPCRAVSEKRALALELTTNPTARGRLDLVVAGNHGPGPGGRVQPDRVARAFSVELTTVCSQVSLKLAALQAAVTSIGS